MWTGPAPMRPYNALVHPRGWRAFMEYGNGIMGDMCVHMFDMVRWMMDLGWPKRSASTRRHSGGQSEQSEYHRHADRPRSIIDDLQDRVAASHLGRAPDPKYPWGATFYGDKGTLKASVDELRLHSDRRRARPIHKDVTYELEQYPEDKTEKDLERHVAPAIRHHMLDFLAAIDIARQAGGGYRAGLYFDGELHSGEPVDEDRADAAVGSGEAGR